MDDRDYYNDSDKWGNYQNITLEDIVNNYIMSASPDDITSTAPRFKIIYHAKRCIRELYYNVIREVRSVELELNTKLHVTVPPDFVSYVRISWLDNNRTLYPLSVDNKFLISKSYLNDNNNILLVNNKSYHFNQDNFIPNKNFSNSYPNGKFTYDSSAGIFQFSSDLLTKKVVIEYISDGLYEGYENQDDSKIRIHKFAESVLNNYIYYELIKNSKNIAANEKARARKEYYNGLAKVKRQLNSIKISDILQAFKGTSRWVKN